MFLLREIRESFRGESGELFNHALSTWLYGALPAVLERTHPGLLLFPSLVFERLGAPFVAASLLIIVGAVVLSERAGPATVNLASARGEVEQIELLPVF